MQRWLQLARTSSWSWLVHAFSPKKTFLIYKKSQSTVPHTFGLPVGKFNPPFWGRSHFSNPAFQEQRQRRSSMWSDDSVHDQFQMYIPFWLLLLLPSPIFQWFQGPCSVHWLAMLTRIIAFEFCDSRFMILLFALFNKKEQFFKV